MASSQSNQSATYSFLVHSSISSEAPPRFDSPANPKQKRKRTSPHDQAVLEAAYQKNSKPDKNERAEIVGKVDLGEKEVQIWFQNRRQNDRRKSKPLEPHELLAHFRNGVPFQSSPGDAQPFLPNAPAPKQTVPTSSPSNQVTGSSSRSPSIHELLNPPLSTEAKRDNEDQSQTRQSSQIPTPPSSFDATRHDPCHSNTAQASAGAPDQPSLHSRKRSHEVMTSTKENSNGSADLSISCTLPPLKKSSSFVRLAMTVDGAVKVRTNNELTPSPPKQRLPPPNFIERRNSTLTRSQSDVHNTFDFKDINPASRRPGGAGFGRSRDARTWEFYCDRDSGEALSTQAEAERNGSAIGAINLIRSSSQRAKVNALNPNFSKQNIQRIPSDAAKQCKPKLSRARSSMARLQSFDIPSDDSESKTKRPRHDRSPSNDSDKENWAPGTRSSHNPLRRMHPSAPRSSILQTQELDASQHGHAARLVNDENLYVASDPNSKPTPSKTKGDDLDCIQGLLSLSQGAWR